MSHDELASLWRSAQNNPSAIQLEREKEKFISDLRRRRRGFIIFMSIVFIWLAIVTVKIVLHTLQPAAGSSPVNWSREWAIIPLFALPWMAWAFFVKQFRRHSQSHPDYRTSIRSTVHALLDENRLARQRNLLVAGLQMAVLLLLPLIVHQLKTVGKAGGEINAMFILFPVLFGGILVAMVRHHVRTLLPRKSQLESLLQSYEG